MHTRFWWGNIMKSSYLADQGDGRTKLRFILTNYVVRMGGV
jgi:hypothetical protein